MDTCVQIGYWEEAFELAAYISRLEHELTYIPLLWVLLNFYAIFNLKWASLFL